MADNSLPAGFTLDAPAAPAALPAGFTLDTPQQPSFMDQLGRQLGLTGRYVLEGAGDAVGVLSNPIQALIAEGTDKQADYKPLGEQAGWLADQLGLPKPEGRLEKDVAGASKALTSTAAMGAGGLASGAAELATQPGLQAASAILGGVGNEEGGPVGGLFGSLAAGAPAGITNASKAILRGGGAAAQQRMADNLAAFEAAGTTPTVGQATQGGYAQWLESVLAKLPGGAGVMAKKAQAQADDLGTRMGKYADALSPGSDPTQAGMAITKGITGEGGFLDRFKQQSSELYDAVDQYLPNGTDGTVIGVPSSLATLYRLTKPIAGAENTSGLLADPKIAQIADALNQDARSAIATMGQPALPYNAIKDLRTMIGNKIADAGLAPDVSTRQLKQLYGALSDDMRNGLKNVSPEAYAANNQAERFVRNGHAQIDQIESIVGKAGGAEKVFNAALSGTKDGASTLNQVMSALRPEEQNVVASAVVRRMGMANPGAQNDAGTAFSTQSFLTNWNKLSPQAKSVLFKNDSELRDNLDQIAKVTSNLREGSKFLANPSGTAAAYANAGAAGAALTALATGQAHAIVPLAAGASAANIGARLMTNPQFVKWLARNSVAPVGVLPAQLGYLSQLGQNDPDLATAAQLIAQGAGGTPQ